MPYHEMSHAEVIAFLGSEPPHTGKLATTRPDGSPHVAPVWFALDGETMSKEMDYSSLGTITRSHRSRPAGARSAGAASRSGAIAC